MNKKQEKAYIKPLTTLVAVIENECIMTASGTTAEGGHNPAQNSDTKIGGGHESAADDGETLTSKFFNFFSDEESNREK